MNGSEAIRLILVGHMIMKNWQSSGLHSYYKHSYFIEHTFLLVMK